eukprot:TRINITY_DN6449_c0_g1_i1.p1 TRINITY_DN6449_c0_g1~~TRINITY_DN6449_c0_g1_i1.p1  ORF type:complete len:358 (-),score=83.61 TRINITY_DN6449_c0_g1_i1:182-1255(-)
MSGFNFGGTQTTGGFSFPSTSTATPAASQSQSSSFSFSFPSSTTTPAATPSTSSLGYASTAPSPFFSSSTTPSMFGNSSTQQSGFSLGTGTTTPSTPSLFGQPAAATPAPVSIKPAPQKYIDELSLAYNPASPACRFRHMFYNLVNPDDVSKYKRPEKTSELLWDQAVKNNPDSTRLVPVQATGFKDLKERKEEQIKMFQKQIEVLQKYQSQLGEVMSDLELQTRVQIDRSRTKHLELSHRILVLIKKIEVIRLTGCWLESEEHSNRVKLDTLQAELNRPNQFKGRINEISSLIRMMEDVQMPNYNVSIDDGSLENIMKFLEQQQGALAHVTDTVKKDGKSLQTIKSLLNEYDPQMK